MPLLLFYYSASDYFDITTVTAAVIVTTVTKSTPSSDRVSYGFQIDLSVLQLPLSANAG